MQEYDIDNMKLQIKNILKNSEEYQDYRLQSLLIDTKDMKKSYGIAMNYNEIVIVDIAKKDTRYIYNAEAYFDIGEDCVFQALQNEMEIGYITMEVHCWLWQEIDRYYPEDITNKKGVQKYLKYCKENKITKEKIEKENKLEDVPNVMKHYKENKEEESVMENNSNELQFYNEAEIRNIITNKDELYVVDDEIAEVIIKFEDIPDFIVDANRKNDVVNLNFYKIGGNPYQPDIATKGEFIKKINPKIRENISDRLIKLQTGKIQLKEYKLIDERKFIKVKRKMEQEMSRKVKAKKKDKGDR